MILTMKNTAILLCGVPLLLATACSSSFSKVRTAINDAPEWYEARRTEIRGEGYPEVIDIPVLDPSWKPQKGLNMSGDELEALQAEFDSSERAEVATQGTAGIEALAAELKAGFEPGLPEAEFLSESEIAAIRASFNVPRVTEGLMTP
jgi:hypothetical protein